MKENIWDLKPAGGGRPVLVSMHGVDANEAISREPERYTRVAPEGTVEYDIEQKRVASVDALAKLKREENEALSEVARKRRDKVDAVHTQKRDEARAAEEARLEREKSETPPNRDGDLQQINAEAAQEEAKIKADFAGRRAELEKQPLPIDPVIPQPTAEEIAEAERLQSERDARKKAGQS